MKSQITKSKKLKDLSLGNDDVIEPEDEDQEEPLEPIAMAQEHFSICNKNLGIEISISSKLFDSMQLGNFVMEIYDKLTANNKASENRKYLG